MCTRAASAEQVVGLSRPTEAKGIGVTYLAPLHRAPPASKSSKDTHTSRHRSGQRSRTPQAQPAPVTRAAAAPPQRRQRPRTPPSWSGLPCWSGRAT